MNLMQNADLTKKMTHYKTKKLFSYLKIGKEILTFGNIEIWQDSCAFKGRRY